MPLSISLKSSYGTWLDWAFRLIIAAVYLLAGIPKLLDPSEFAKAIVNYRVAFPLIGQDYVYPVAIFLPPLECVAAFALFHNRTKRIGAITSGAMLVMFIILITQAVLRGLNIDCGCFGTGAVSNALAQKVGLSKIAENTVLLMMCAYIAVWRSEDKAITVQNMLTIQRFSQKVRRENA